MTTYDLTAEQAAALAATIDPTEAAVARFRRALTTAGPAVGLGPLERTILVGAVVDRTFPGATIKVTLADQDFRHVGREIGHGTLVDVTDGPSVEAVEAALSTHLDGVGDRPVAGTGSGWIHVRRWLSPGTFAALMIHECRRRKGRDRLLVPPQPKKPEYAGYRHRGTVHTNLVRQAVKDLAIGPAIGPGLSGRPPRSTAGEWEQLLRVGPVLAALADVARPIPALGFAAAAWERDSAARQVVRTWRRTSIKALELLVPGSPTRDTALAPGEPDPGTASSPTVAA